MTGYYLSKAIAFGANTSKLFSASNQQAIGDRVQSFVLSKLYSTVVFST